ncbi:MAG TPA: pentapeptide repeat-containing protein [Allosphingosinicella sp.]|jgi:hypothetical protein
MELIRSLDIDPVTELRGADWRGTNFAACDLRNADFSECRLSFCDFTDADVAGAIFYGADLYLSRLHRAQNVTLAYLDDEQHRYLDYCRTLDARGDGDQGRVVQINQKIRGARSFGIAKSQYRSILQAGLQPDQYSASMLIGQARTPQEAWEAYELIHGSRGKINDIGFTILASKMRTVDEVRVVMATMRALGIEPGARIYNTLLSRTSGRQEVKGVLAEMRENDIRRDNVTYSILMRREGYSERLALFGELLAGGLQPHTADLNILLRGAEDEEQADEVLEIATEQGIRRDYETYALLAPHKTRLSAFRALIDDMIEDELFRHTEFYALAIGRAKNFADACFLLGRMKLDRVAPDIAIYNGLRRLAGRPAIKLGAEAAKWPDLAIDYLVRSVGTLSEIGAAGLNDNLPDTAD